MLSAKKIYCTVVDSSIFVAILMFPITVLGESGSIEILERSQQRPPISTSTTYGAPVEERLIQAVKKLEIDTQDEEDIKNVLTKVIENSLWKIKSLTVRRFKVNRGLKTTVRMRLDTGSSCIRNERWIALLGKPRSLNLAQPFGYVDISTPENVDQYLSAHVVALHYRLEGYNAYSIYSDDKSGCFKYLRVN